MPKFHTYNQGQMAVGKTSNAPFSATITNNDGVAMTNVVVSLNITGANTFSTTATIPSLTACSSSLVNFAALYTPLNEGVDTIRVSIPPDANNANNVLTVLSTVDKQNLAFKKNGETSTGGGGFNAGTGTIAIKFKTAVPAVLTHANVHFNTVTVPSQYRVAIYPDNSGVPGTTAIYTDANNRTNATGSYSVKLDAPVNVPAGTFYLAMQQMSLDNMASGFVNESPVRPSTFFFSSNPPATWTDISTTTLPSKLLSGVRFCSPVTPNAIVGPTVGCEGSSYLFTVDTAGKDGASSFTWILPPGYNGTSSTDSINIIAGPTNDTIRCVAVFPCGLTDTVKLAFTSAPITNELALSNVGNTLSTTGTASKTSIHADGQIAYYSDINCKPIGILSDAIGGNVLGSTTFSVTVDPSVQTYSGQPYLRRNFMITPTSNGPGDVLLFISQADFTDYNTAAVGWPQLPIIGNNADPNIANIRITKVDGALGVGPATVITPLMNWNATTNYWEAIFNVSGFSSFYIHAANPANQALAVAWQSFNVKKENNASLISWSTSSETNNQHFIIQHSIDGQTFNPIGKVNSKAINGFSEQLNSYKFMHDQPLVGHNYYRLEQVDLDGKSSFSEIKDLIWGGNGNTYTMYPQPSNDILYIDAAVEKSQQLSLEITDMTGKIISTQHQKMEKGVNNFSVDVSVLSNGIYIIRILENNNLSFTQKVTIRH